MVLSITGVRQRRRVVPASKTGAKAESGSNPTAPAKSRLFNEDGRYTTLATEIENEITWLLQGYLKDKEKEIDHRDLQSIAENAVEMIMLDIRLNKRIKI